MPIGTADATHLLRRAGFGGTPAEVATLGGLEPADAVNAVLDTGAAPPASRPAFMDDANIADWEKVSYLQRWWLDRMRTTPVPIVEKLALFWHGHFATSQEKVGNAEMMYQQNQTLRAQGMGSFEDLCRAVCLGPAMIIYLDNDPNLVGSPNENLAREVFELFTLGVNIGYTQNDVVEAARAWTGHGIDDDTGLYEFRASQHDHANKTIFGITRNWDGPELLTHVCTQEPHRTYTARFLARKLWSFYAYPNPPAAVLDALVTDFVASGLDVTALLRSILSHPEFYSSTAKQGLVRSPTEWVVALLKTYNVDAYVTNPQWWMETMGQSLFYPPNVAGWKANQYWISTTSFWAKADMAGSLLWRNETNAFLSAIQSRTGNAWNVPVVDAVQQVLSAFGVPSPSSETRSALETYLTVQRVACSTPEWSWPDWGYLDLRRMLPLTPEFQLA